VTLGSTPPDIAPRRFIGCDVGQDSIAVFDSASGKPAIVQNGLAALAAFARDLDPTCLVQVDEQRRIDGSRL
jgi:hypothetical protein